MSNTTKICPACGKEIPALASFCPECGCRVSNMDPEDLKEREELEAAMNEETPEVDRRQIDDQMAKRRESYQRALEERKKRTRRMIPLVVLLVAGAIGGGIYAGSRVLKNGNLPPMSTENPEAQPTGESPQSETASAETTPAVTTQAPAATTPAATTALESSASETLPAAGTTAESTAAAAETTTAAGATTAAGTTAAAAAATTAPTTAAGTTSAATNTAAAETTTTASATTAAPTTTAPETTKAPGTSMYCAQNLNVRNAPSGDKIGSIGVGETVQVLDDSGSWYKVYYNGKEAYVWGEYVKKTQDEAREASKAYAEKEEKSNSDSGSSGFSSGKLSRSEVANMSQKELRLARNEIYARHGAIFNDSSLQKYFEGKSWYTPRTKAANIDWDDLTATEQANLSLIAEYEN